jgi:trimeric autotransporter adhesin
MSTHVKSALYTLAGALAGVLVVTTTALAGSGVGDVFNLGQTNTVDAQTSLTGNPGANPALKVTSTGTAAAVRGVATTGIGTNGISTSGVGQQGLSDSGIGTLGTHGNTTGISPGVQGETNSTDPTGAGVVGKNNGGGPGLKAIVNAGAPPLSVNSQVKVANLNADKLDDLDSSALQKRVSAGCTSGQAIRVVNQDGSVSCEPVGLSGAWGLTGNSGTTPGTNFLGTTDNQALELKVNGQRTLRLEPGATSPNLLGGFSANAVLAGAVGSTISGGGESVAANLVSDNFGTVGGGEDNVAGDQDAGNDPTTSEFATVAGGLSNTASGTDSTVGGGQNNIASALWSAVPGGAGNTAGGLASFAAGFRAKANHRGAFVWADSQIADMNSSSTDQFIARALGHFFLQSDSTLDDQSGFINTSTGAFLSTGGTWTNASSRTLKEGFAQVKPERILEKVAALPITSWHYKAEPGARHIGPVSEDFHRAFGVGENPRSIGTVDADGVALAAIQGLYRQNQALRHENSTLRAQLAAHNARLTKLEHALSALTH